MSDTATASSVYDSLPSKIKGKVDAKVAEWAKKQESTPSEDQRQAALDKYAQRYLKAMEKQAKANGADASSASSSSGSARARSKPSSKKLDRSALSSAEDLAWFDEKLAKYKAAKEAEVRDGKITDEVAQQKISRQEAGLVQTRLAEQARAKRKAKVEAEMGGTATNGDSDSGTSSVSDTSTGGGTGTSASTSTADQSSLSEGGREWVKKALEKYRRDKQTLVTAGQLSREDMETKVAARETALVGRRLEHEAKKQQREKAKAEDSGYGSGSESDQESSSGKRTKRGTPSTTAASTASGGETDTEAAQTPKKAERRKRSQEKAEAKAAATEAAQTVATAATEAAKSVADTASATTSASEAESSAAATMGLNEREKKKNGKKANARAVKALHDKEMVDEMRTDTVASAAAPKVSAAPPTTVDPATITAPNRSIKTLPRQEKKQRDKAGDKRSRRSKPPPESTAAAVSTAGASQDTKASSAGSSADTKLPAEVVGVMDQWMNPKLDLLGCKAALYGARKRDYASSASSLNDQLTSDFLSMRMADSRSLYDWVREDGRTTADIAANIRAEAFMDTLATTWSPASGSSAGGTEADSEKERVAFGAFGGDKQRRVERRMKVIRPLFPEATTPPAGKSTAPLGSTAGGHAVATTSPADEATDIAPTTDSTAAEPALAPAAAPAKSGVISFNEGSAIPTGYSVINTEPLPATIVKQYQPRVQEVLGLYMDKHFRPLLAERGGGNGRESTGASAGTTALPATASRRDSGTVAETVTEGGESGAAGRRRRSGRRREKNSTAPLTGRQDGGTAPPTVIDPRGAGASSSREASTLPAANTEASTA